MKSKSSCIVWLQKAPAVRRISQVFLKTKATKLRRWVLRLQFLDDHWIGEPRLLDGLRRVCELRRREAHGLQAVASLGGGPRGIDEGADISDCVVIVEAGDHASSVRQPQLNWGGRQRLVHREPTTRGRPSGATGGGGGGRRWGRAGSGGRGA